MSDSKLAKTSVLIIAFGLISKFMALVRQSSIGAIYGQSGNTDAYMVAMKIIIISTTMLGVILNTTLIPLLTEIQNEEDKKKSDIFFNSVLNWVLLISFFTGFIIYFFAPQLVKITALGYKGEQFELAVNLVRLASPMVFGLNFAFLFGNYLQSEKIFGPYAATGIIYNLIFFFAFFILKVGNSIRGLMIITICATVSQAIFLIPFLRNVGYEYKPTLKIKKRYRNEIFILIIPIILGEIIQLVNVLVNQNLASFLEKGVISALDNVNKLNNAILSIFIAAFTTAIFPYLSDAFSKSDRKKIVEMLDLGVITVFLITLPATIMIMSLSTPIIKLIFERNQFTPENTVITAGALYYYTIGMSAMAMRMHLYKAYFSFHDTKTPMLNGAVTVLFEVIFSLLLIKPMGYKGLALAYSIGMTSGVLIMFVKLKKKVPEINVRKYMINFLKIILSSVMSGISVKFIYNILINGVLGFKLGNFLSVLISSTLGLVTYVILILLLKVQEFKIFIKSLLKHN